MYEWTQLGISTFASMGYSQVLGNPVDGGEVTSAAMDLMKAQRIWEGAIAGGYVAIRTQARKIHSLAPPCRECKGFRITNLTPDLSGPPSIF